MVAKRIIPCLDVKDGRVVKGVKFQGLADAGDPAQCAARYSDEGADEIAFLDITASYERRKTIIDVVEKTAEQVFVPLSVGGGIRSAEDIRALLLAGADKAVINTAAVENPNIVSASAERFGSQCIVVAIDARRENSGSRGENSWQVFTHGGRNPAGICALEWAKKMENLGAGEILLTSMDNDGTRSGYDLPLTKAVCEAAQIPVIASGGVGTREHFLEGALCGANALLAASVFHYGDLTIGEVKHYLASKGVEARL